jgi:hypothetical protein
MVLQPGMTVPNGTGALLKIVLGEKTVKDFLFTTIIIISVIITWQLNLYKNPNNVV